MTLLRSATPILYTAMLLACSGAGNPPPADGGVHDGGTTSQCQASTAAALFADTGTYTHEYFVDRDHGDDNNDGSSASPWRSLAHGAFGRVAGDRVHIRAGTYFECLHVDTAPGTAEHPIQFVGDGEVRIFCMDSEAVMASGASYLSIEHLIVSASAGDTNAIHIDSGSHHILIRHVEVRGTGAGGDCIKINQTDDVWILDNDLHNADTSAGSAQGIDMVAVHRAQVARNHVHDLIDTQGIFAKGGASDVVIEQNLIERLASNGADAIGIVLGGVTDRPLFVPINADYEATGLIARNNVIIGADGGGIGAQGCHDCTIANNTLWNTGHHGYAIPLSQGATGMGASTMSSVNVNLRVINNLVGNPFGTMRAPIQAEPSQRQGLVLSHNWWWNGTQNDVFDPGYNHAAGVDEPGSHVDQDPQVVNGEADPPDVHLAPASPARGAGQMLDIVTDDYNGACRSGPVDVGAMRAQ